MVDIVKVTVKFVSSETKYFRMYSGAFVRGFVYWVLSRTDRTFAKKLHSSKSLAPFSVTPVMNDYKSVEKLEEGKEYTFTISFFVPEIGMALKNYLTSTDKIFFAGCENELKEVTVRYCDLKNIEESPIKKFRVNFVTPCYFRKPSNDYRFVPLPLPELMFRSLARLYSAFVSEIPEGYREWLDAGGIAVSGLDIRTEKVLLKKGLWSVGFTGWVNFTLPDDVYREDFSKLTSRLLKFGEYSNVGGGRTSGLGLIKVDKMEVIE